jgi:hypothetical protein
MNRIYYALLDYKIAGRSVVELFISLPSREEYPDYYEVIENLIDLTMIKQKIDSREYRCLADLERDVRLLVTNAKTYNERTSQVYKDATLLLVLNINFSIIIICF